MLRAGTLGSQWVTQKITSSSSATAFESALVSKLSVVSHAHPIILSQGTRRLSLRASADFATGNSGEAVTVERWHKNIARLYARHILELAAAAAAASTFITRLEEIHSIPEKPSNWENWQRREWANELYQSLGNNSLSRVWSAAKRMVNLSLLVAPMTVLYPLGLVSERMQDVSWKYALWGIEQAGPTYIKLIQWATTRQDLFSPEFCAYFGKLRDETVGHTWEETVKIVMEDLGIDITSAKDITKEQNSYLALDPKPIGSGCIAQVYHGKLLQSTNQYPAGTEVAVKVQHPRIWHKVCVDFYIMGKVAKFLEDIPYLNLKYLSLHDSVRQFRDIMLPQLDLTLEAKHLTRFNRDFADDDRVSFPKPVNDLTATRVLTETFVNGRPIMEFLNASTADRKKLAELGLQTTLKMIFHYDFIHGDLHPGNLLVSGTSGNLKLHLLDCGLVVQIGPEQHVNLVKILGAFIRKNGKLAGQLMVDTSNDSQASPQDIELFVKGIEQIVKDDENQNFIEKVGDYITDICYMACRRKVKLEPSFVNAALAVEIMEGIASALDPTLVVTKKALPIVMQAELMHNLPTFQLWR